MKTKMIRTDLRRYHPLALAEYETLATGQAADLKFQEDVDGVQTRWWLSRCSAEDGETHQVHVEQYIDGRWLDVDKYAPVPGAMP